MKREGNPSGPARQPWMKFYVADFLASAKVRRMSLEELGAYTLLLLEAWQADGLPNDPQEVADILRVDLARAEQIMAGVVGRCFTVADDGRLRNARQEQERAQVNEVRAKRAEAGRRGGAASASAREASASNCLASASVCSANAKQTDLICSDLVCSDLDGGSGGKATPLARAVAKELEPVPPAVQEALDAWATHRREIGKPLGASSIRALIAEGRRNATDFAARVRSSIEHGTTVLLEAERSTGQTRGLVRKTATQTIQGELIEMQREAAEADALDAHLARLFPDAPKGDKP